MPEGFVPNDDERVEQAAQRAQDSAENQAFETETQRYGQDLWETQDEWLDSTVRGWFGVGRDQITPEFLADKGAAEPASALTGSVFRAINRMAHAPFEVAGTVSAIESRTPPEEELNQAFEEYEAGKIDVMELSRRVKPTQEFDHTSLGWRMAQWAAQNREQWDLWSRGTFAAPAPGIPGEMLEEFVNAGVSVAMFAAMSRMGIPFPVAAGIVSGGATEGMAPKDWEVQTVVSSLHGWATMKVLGATQGMGAAGRVGSLYAWFLGSDPEFQRAAIEQDTDAMARRALVLLPTGAIALPGPMMAEREKAASREAIASLAAERAAYVDALPPGVKPGDVRPGDRIFEFGTGQPQVHVRPGDQVEFMGRRPAREPGPADRVPIAMLRPRVAPKPVVMARDPETEAPQGARGRERAPAPESESEVRGVLDQVSQRKAVRTAAFDEAENNLRKAYNREPKREVLEEPDLPKKEAAFSLVPRDAGEPLNPWVETTERAARHRVRMRTEGRWGIQISQDGVRSGDRAPKNPAMEVQFPNYEFVPDAVRGKRIWLGNMSVEQALRNVRVTVRDQQRAHDWYIDLWRPGGHYDFLVPGREREMNASFAMSQRNDSPVGGGLNLIRLLELGLSPAGAGMRKKAGMSSQAMRDAFLGITNQFNGDGSKILDFADLVFDGEMRARGQRPKLSRTAAKDDPRAGPPIASDVHVARATGYVDRKSKAKLEDIGRKWVDRAERNEDPAEIQKAKAFLKAMTDLQIDIGAKASSTSPDSGMYEAVSDFVNRVFEDSKNTEFGSEIEGYYPGGLQALFWAQAAEMMPGVRPSGVAEIFGAHHRTTAYEIAPEVPTADFSRAHPDDFRVQFGRIYSGLDTESQLGLTASLGSWVWRNLARRIGMLDTTLRGTFAWSKWGMTPNSGGAVMSHMTPQTAEVAALAAQYVFKQNEVWQWRPRAANQGPVGRAAERAVGIRIYDVGNSGAMVSNQRRQEIHDRFRELTGLGMVNEETGKTEGGHTPVMVDGKFPGTMMIEAGRFGTGRKSSYARMRSAAQEAQSGKDQTIGRAIRAINEEFGTDLRWGWLDLELKATEHSWNDDPSGGSLLRRIRGSGRGDLADWLEHQFAPTYEQRALEAARAAANGDPGFRDLARAMRFAESPFEVYGDGALPGQRTLSPAFREPDGKLAIAPDGRSHAQWSREKYGSSVPPKDVEPVFYDHTDRKVYTPRAADAELDRRAEIELGQRTGAGFPIAGGSGEKSQSEIDSERMLNFIQKNAPKNIRDRLGDLWAEVGGVEFENFRSLRSFVEGRRDLAIDALPDAFSKEDKAMYRRDLSWAKRTLEWIDKQVASGAVVSGGSGFRPGSGARVLDPETMIAPDMSIEATQSLSMPGVIEPRPARAIPVVPAWKNLKTGKVVIQAANSYATHPAIGAHYLRSKYGEKITERNAWREMTAGGHEAGFVVKETGKFINRIEAHRAYGKGEATEFFLANVERDGRSIVRGGSGEPPDRRSGEERRREEERRERDALDRFWFGSEDGLGDRRQAERRISDTERDDEDAMIVKHWIKGASEGEGPGRIGQGVPVDPDNPRPQWTHAKPGFLDEQNPHIEAMWRDIAEGRGFIPGAKPERRGERLERARRGTLTQADVAHLASQLGMSEKDFLEASSGSILTVEQQHRLISYFNESVTDMGAALRARQEAIEAGNIEAANAANDAARALMDRSANHLMLYMASGSEAGRTLGARRGMRAQNAINLGLRRVKMFIERGNVSKANMADILREIQEAGGIDNREAVRRVLTKWYQPTFADKFNEFRANALLTPMSIIRNVVGNSWALSWQLAEDTAQVIMDPAVRKLMRGTALEGVLPRTVQELRAQQFGTLQGLREGAKLALRVLRDENAMFEVEGRFRDEIESMPAIGGRLGTVVRLTGRAQTIGDAIYYEALMRRRLWMDAVRLSMARGEPTDQAWRAAARLVEDALALPTEKFVPLAERMSKTGVEGMRRGALRDPFPDAPLGSGSTQQEYEKRLQLLRARAHEEALRITFRAPIPNSAIISQAVSRFRSSGAGTMKDIVSDPRNFVAMIFRFVVPYYQTPRNVFSHEIENSPITMFVHPRNRDRLKSRDPDQVSAFLSKLMLSSVLAAGIAALVQDGWITGPGPADSDARDLMTKLGREPSQLRIPVGEDGDQFLSIPLTGLSPIAEPILAIAAIMEAGNWGDDEVMKDPMGWLVRSNILIARETLNQPFLTGVSDVFDAITADDPIEQGKQRQLVQRAAGGLLVPGTLRWLASELDPLRRARQQSVSDTLRNSIPLLREQRPPHRDALGNTFENTLRMIEAWVPREGDKVDPIYEWLWEVREDELTSVIGRPGGRFLRQPVDGAAYEELLRVAGHELKVGGKSLNEILDNAARKRTDPNFTQPSPSGRLVQIGAANAAGDYETQRQWIRDVHSLFMSQARQQVLPVAEMTRLMRETHLEPQIGGKAGEDALRAMAYPGLMPSKIRALFGPMLGRLRSFYENDEVEDAERVDLVNDVARVMANPASFGEVQQKWLEIMSAKSGDLPMTPERQGAIK